MPNETSFSANTAGAHVAGTLRDNLPINPNVPPLGLQAIGARVTLAFKGLWNADASYMYYDVVHDAQGASYIGKAQAIPAGTALTDTNYWIRWADPNAQYEELETIVNTFNARITQNASDITDEATAREAADTQLANADLALSDRIDAKPNITVYDDASYDYVSHQAQFMYGDDFAPSAYVKAVTDEDIFKTTLQTGEYRFGNSSNIDICAAITLANSYLANASSFYYGNAYTGISYEGTYDNPTRSNPRAHMNELSQMPIDCNAFTQLVGHGVLYNDSTYAANVSVRTRGLHPMFKDDSNVVKSYWSYNGIRDGHDNAMGYGRMLSDGFAKFLYDSGMLELIPTGSAEALVPGKIYFSGDISAHPDRFLGITHCYMVTGMASFNYASKIVSHAVTEGLISQGIADTQLVQQTVAAFTPNWSAGPYLANANADRAFFYNNRNLSANPLSHDFTIGSSVPQLGARVVSLCCANASDYISSVTIKATNRVTNTSVSATISLGASPHIVYLPYEYDVEISSTSTKPVNVVCQSCSSDRNIILARPSA